MPDQHSSHTMFTYTKFYKSTRSNYRLQSLRIYRSVTTNFRTTTASEPAQCMAVACIGCWVRRVISTCSTVWSWDLSSLIASAESGFRCSCSPLSLCSPVASVQHRNHHGQTLFHRLFDVDIETCEHSCVSAVGASNVSAVETEVSAGISLYDRRAGSGFGIWSGPPTGGWADAALTELK